MTPFKSLGAELCRNYSRHFPAKRYLLRNKELRKERKLSQEELALAVGTTRQTITSIETGKYVASLPLAFKIAHYFDLTIEEVFDFSEYLDSVSYTHLTLPTT